VNAKRIPTKQELLQLQKLYRTDKRIGQALGSVPEQLVAYWRRKKGIGKSVFPKYTQREISELWERFGDDLLAGQELGITKQAFYRWRKKYKIFNRPAILRLEQLELKFFDEQRLNRSGEKVWPAQTFLQKIVSFHDPGKLAAIGQRSVVPVDRLVTFSNQGILAAVPNTVGVASDLEVVESFESFLAMFDGGHFQSNQVIVSDRPEAAVLAVTASYVKTLPPQQQFLDTAPKVVEIEVSPTLKIILPGASTVKLNTFDTACRIFESLTDLREKAFIIELSGPGVEGLPLEDRMTLLAYTAFLTGRQVIIEPDQTFLNFLSRFGKGENPIPFSDKNAPVLETITLTTSKRRSGAYSLHKREFLFDSQEYAARQLRRFRVGPLMGGGIDDFRLIAQSIRGDAIRKPLQLYLIPASQAVFAEALRRRYVHAIVEAGGRVGNVSCSPQLPKLLAEEYELTTELSTDSDSLLVSVHTIVQSLRSGKLSRRIFD
jgi:hypothetical protein